MGRKLRDRVLAALCTVAMVFTMCPATQTLAYASEQTEGDSGDITLQTQDATALSDDEAADLVAGYDAVKAITSDTHEIYESGVYTIESDVTIAPDESGSALKILGEIEVVLYIPAGKTLTVTGANGNGTEAGSAAIYLPSEAKLDIVGEGTLNATGGNAGNGVNGTKGTDANSASASGRHFAGNGGLGGNGGGGAGAAIGTSGGNGGKADTVSAKGQYDEGYYFETYKTGEPGHEGESGESADAAGKVYVAGGVTLNAKGGSAGSAGRGGAAGRSVENPAFVATTFAGGGAGGGGGAAGQAAYAIGSGGAGGGAGGGGAGGAVGSDTAGTDPGAWGGEGGKAASGASNGATGGRSGDNDYVARGGKAGDAGTGSASTTIYRYVSASLPSHASVVNASSGLGANPITTESDAEAYKSDGGFTTSVTFDGNGGTFPTAQGAKSVTLTCVPGGTVAYELYDMISATTRSGKTHVEKKDKSFAGYSIVKDDTSASSKFYGFDAATKTETWTNPTPLYNAQWAKTYVLDSDIASKTNTWVRFTDCTFYALWGEYVPEPGGYDTINEITSNTHEITQSGVYTIYRNVTIDPDASGSALRIADNIEVVLYIPKDKILTVTGRNGNGTQAGCAAILLPEHSKLNIVGEGTLNATGGNAGNGANGTNGGNASSPTTKGLHLAGAGGLGGDGGGGAGAAIGTSGGSGGVADRTAASGIRDEGYYCKKKQGQAGKAGGAGQTAAAAGTVYLGGSVTVNATAGKSGTAGRAGAAGRNADNTHFLASICTGGGGAGAGGAAGQAAYAIGSGGAGGGAGGGGAGGGIDQKGSALSSPENMLGCGGNGGQAAAGAPSGQSGNGASYSAAGGAGGATGAGSVAATTYLYDNSDVTSQSANLHATSALGANEAEEVYDADAYDAAGGFTTQVTFNADGGMFPYEGGTATISFTYVPGATVSYELYEEISAVTQAGGVHALKQGMRFAGYGITKGDKSATSKFYGFDSLTKAETWANPTPLYHSVLSKAYVLEKDIKSTTNLWLKFRDCTFYALWDSGTYDISNATIAAIPDQTYTGDPITPAVTVTYSGATLVEGTDYTVSYKDNTAVGTATVTVTGIGNYTGTKTSTFTIKKARKTIDDGVYTIKSALGTLVDVKDGSTKTGANIQAYKANGSAAQTFRFTYDEETEAYKIENLKSGKVLDVANAKAASGTNVQQYSSNDTLAQRWYVEEVEDGYVIESALDSAYVLDVSGASAASGANIQIYKANGTLAQTWSIDSATYAKTIDEGTYVIESARDTHMVLDIANGSVSNGANLQLYSANKTEAQGFTFNYDEETGFYEIVNVKSGKAIDLAGAVAASGTNVQQYQRNDSLAQRWIVKKTESGLKICSAIIPNLVIDLAAGTTSNGANIRVWVDNGTKAQRWIAS